MSAVTLDHARSRLPIIDGLRAIAVVAVVLFHFFPEAVTGGYIGVDVFFVISGFVIARRYLPAMAAREVGLWAFYRRRIQRLLPAYLVVLAVVTLAAYALLPPMELKNYGQSLAGQAIYLQNVVFWLQGDYFDAAQTKPLLHTWSLAVEEQFYLFFPILVLAFRRSRVLTVVLLAAAFAGSLGLGWIVAGASPKTAFYLLPTRVWEFVAGIAAATIFGRIELGRWSATAFLAGLALIAWSIAGFGEADPFPGPQALIAVAGTAMVCLVQGQVRGPVAGLLTNPIAQEAGRISYSWYLWHWPLVVLFNAVTGRLPGPWEGLAGVALSALLALASHRLIERPALDNPRLRAPCPALMLLGAMAAGTLACGLWFFATNGALWRYPPERRVLFAAEMQRGAYRCSWRRLLYLDHEVCRLTKGEGLATLLIGDSHADLAKEPLSVLARRAGSPLYLTQRNCRPYDYGVLGHCPMSVWREVRADMRRYDIRRIVLIGFWPNWTTQAEYRTGLTRLLDTGAEVFVQKVAPNSFYFDPVPRTRDAVYPVYTAEDYARDYAVQNRVFAEMARANPRLHILDPVPYLCDGPCDFATDGKPNYLDSNHLNLTGLARLRGMYENIYPPMRDRTR